MPNQNDRPYLVVSAQTMAELEEKVNKIVLEDRYALMPGISVYYDEIGTKFYVKELVSIYLANWSNGSS